MDRSEPNPKYRLSFLTILALLSICLLVAGLFPSRDTAFGNVWIVGGLFGLSAAVGLAESAKSEVRTQKKLLDSYLAEARTDPMLGLANRRAFDLELERLTRECKSTSERLSVLLIDLDHFDAFNREHGYHNGDDMLRAVARILRARTKGIGIASRVGGDQLAVILAGVRLEAACHLAQQIHQAISNHQINAPGGDLSTSASVAVVERRLDESSHDVFQRLRACLYAAKEKGRNRVFVHDGEAATPATADRSTDLEQAVSAAV